MAQRAYSVGADTRTVKEADSLCELCTQFVSVLVRSGASVERSFRKQHRDESGSSTPHEGEKEVTESFGSPTGNHHPRSSHGMHDAIRRSSYSSEDEGRTYLGDLDSDLEVLTDDPEDPLTKSTYRRPKEYEFEHHDHWWSLVESALSDCKLCYLMLYELRRTRTEKEAAWEQTFAFTEEDIGGGSFRVLWTFEDDRTVNRLWIDFKSEHREYPRRWTTNQDVHSWIEAYVPEGTSSAQLPWVSARDIMPHARMCYPTIRRWLKDCLNGHKHCCAQSDTDPDPELPTRVLDVAAFSQSADVRLCLSNGKRAQYITLSHCWGLKLPLRTTQSTLGDHLNRIKYTNLPRSFADAVDVTRMLGLRYIWIDSLCIIQDSAEDWAAEAGRMADVYGNSFLTIASACSTDSYGGMMLPRPGLLSCSSGTPSGTINFRPHADLATPFQAGGAIFGRHYNSVPGYSPLTQRAWCFQEEYLSPRIVYFTKSQLYWSCKTLAAAEGSSTVVTHSDPEFSRSLALGSVKDVSDTSLLWYAAVEQVTSRGLTYGQDKLICMAGVARKFQTQLGSKYLSGLWDHDIHTGLVWHLQRDDDLRCTPVKEYRAPSWSWAATNGPIDWTRNPYLQARCGGPDDLDILEYNVQPKDIDNPFGQIENAYLDLVGTFGKARYEPFREYGTFGWTWVVSGWESWRLYDEFFDHNKRRPYIADFFLLQVSAWMRTEFDSEDNPVDVPYTAYLIIEPVDEDVYQRAGLAWAMGRLPENCGWERKRIRLV